MQFSQTQLANFSTAAGLLVVIAGQFNFIIPNEQAVFILAALWSVCSVAYNFYQRWKKGDVTLGGIKFRA